ncbi:MAG: glucose 1-dehydrogenase [Armatimonadetes bacterium]|nr:glucose 1-dehydrogenase [Armatimonadota bacterium]
MSATPTKEQDDSTQPMQHQDDQPGQQSQMTPEPEVAPKPKDEGKLEGKVAIITGGDSGIGQSVAIAFAEEGADVVIAYLSEDGDAQKTQAEVENRGRRCIMVAGDLGQEDQARKVVDAAVQEFGKLDVLVNNAAEQHPQESIENISQEQLERTFRTNIFSYFYMVKAAMPHLQEGAAIINTASVTAYRGSPGLHDYSATKGAIVAFTRSLSGSLVKKKIRVNAVAPGPIWTPLIPSTFPAVEVDDFGKQTPMQRPGQPNEVAPCFVFLASDDSSYMTGQVLHPNGGEIVNG